VEKLFIVPLKYPFTLNKEGSWMNWDGFFWQKFSKILRTGFKVSIFKSK
jgi:hypothetical protein